MGKARKIHPLLARMGRIERMERGTICRMAGRPHYNHQTWLNGRNVVRYVPAGEVASLQEAIDGYASYQKLAQEYADIIIRQTRRKRANESGKNKRAQRREQSKKARTSESPSKGKTRQQRVN